MQASLLFSASALSVAFQPVEVPGSWQRLLLMWSGLLPKSALITSQVLTPCVGAVACQPRPADTLNGLLQHRRRKPGFILAHLGASHSTSFEHPEFLPCFLCQRHSCITAVIQRPGSYPCLGLEWCVSAEHLAHPELASWCSALFCFCSSALLHWDPLVAVRAQAVSH